MERGKYRTILASLAGGLWMLMVVGLSFAAEEAKPAEEPPKAEAPAAAPAGACCGCAGAETAALFHGDESGSKEPAVARSDRRELPASGRRRPATARATSLRS